LSRAATRAEGTGNDVDGVRFARERWSLTLLHAFHGNGARDETCYSRFKARFTVRHRHLNDDVTDNSRPGNSGFGVFGGTRHNRHKVYKPRAFIGETSSREVLCTQIPPILLGVAVVREPAPIPADRLGVIPGPAMRGVLVASAAF